MRIDRLRRVTQFLVGGLLANGWLPVFWTKVIYQGPLKSFCIPLLNCHGCPLAIFSCPIGAMSHFVAIRAFPFLIVGFLGLVGLAVGRMACGWLCPFGLMQDLMYRVRTRKYRLPRAFRYGKYVSLVLLVGLVTYLSGETWFCRLCPWGGLEAGLPWMIWSPRDALTGAEIVGWSMVGPLFAVKMAVVAVFLVLFVLIKRPFCRTACPLGAFWALFNTVSLVKVDVDKDGCVDCVACWNVCPVDLPVRSKTDTPDGPECVRCLLCTQAKGVRTRVGRPLGC